MNNPMWDQIEGKWKQLSGQIREKWGELTNDDLDQIRGRRDQLAGKLQERYGMAREEANRQIDEWAQNLKF
ncbi:MAG TPA: CsbD family protein [Spirillospora sp.]|nr:CsbD family protein [Spirillospora sp.]